MDVEKTIEFILQTQAKTEATLDRLAERDAAARARMDSWEHRMDRMDAYMRRAVRLGVREARAEREKRRELDEKLTQLAASHLLTEEALRQLSARVDAFLAGLRSGNGHPPA